MASKKNRRRLRDTREYHCGRCRRTVPWPLHVKHGEGKCLPAKVRKYVP